MTPPKKQISSLEKDRLLSFINFAQQTARLNRLTFSHVEQHKLFKIYEHELSNLTGIQLNLTTSDDQERIWMSVARVQESQPPPIK